MTYIQLTVPPLPNYIICDKRIMYVGDKHMSRKNFGIFDLLFVTKGCMYITEDGVDYELCAGDVLVLLPDAHHFGTKTCDIDTEYFFLHFSTIGSWTRTQQQLNSSRELAQDKREGYNPTSETYYFTIQFPTFLHIEQGEVLSHLLEQLMEVRDSWRSSMMMWKQQAICQEILMLLATSGQTSHHSLSYQCAELAAAYLREHYQEEVTAQALGDAINFHPVYIARCMKQQFGCSPIQYLHDYRIERAKLLLMQSDSSIMRIAEEVGFQSAAYFSSSFSRYEGVSPRHYRQQFR